MSHLGVVEHGAMVGGQASRSIENHHWWTMLRDLVFKIDTQVVPTMAFRTLP
jgi:hypothetical protein